MVGFNGFGAQNTNREKKLLAGTPCNFYIIKH